MRPHDVNTREFDLLLGGHRVKVRNKENKWGIKAVESGGKKKQITFFYKKCVHPMLQKRNYLKLETRYVKTGFRNGIYDKFCIKMGVLDFGQNRRKPLYFVLQATLIFLALFSILLYHLLTHVRMAKLVINFTHIVKDFSPKL